MSPLLGCNAAFDPAVQEGFTPEHYFVLSRVADGLTMQELIDSIGLPRERVLAMLRDLHSWGAVTVRETDDVPIVDQTDLGVVSLEEAALLSEDVELEPWEKRRAIAVMRTIREGNARELLGVNGVASVRAVKRAYFALAKEFHPDRYWGKRLGSFAGMLASIFASLSAAAKAMADPRTASGSDIAARRTRRRRDPRYVFAASVDVRCASWPVNHTLHTLDMSATGIFLSSELAAKCGDSVELEFNLQDGCELSVRGTVVTTRTSEQAFATGKRAGFGVRLDPMSGPQLESYRDLLEVARRNAPAPGGGPTEPLPSPDTLRQRRARGTEPGVPSPPIVGIDFGTSFTSISAAAHGQVTVLKWPDGSHQIPSVVAFPQRGQAIVGWEARKRLVADPRHTVPAAKRLLGRDARDIELEAHLAQAGYQHEIAADGNLVVDMWGEPYAVAQICSYLLSEARDAAERALGQPVSRVVLSAPVSFGEERLALLRRAARLAHLDVVEIIDEPSAAALANRFRGDFGGVIGVYDFGGGTFDFSIVDASGGDFQVLATAGDSWLGGDDFDMVLADAIANRYWQRHGADLRHRAVEWQYLLRSVEHAKRTLSLDEQARVFVPEVMRTAQGTQDLNVRLTRTTVEQLWAPVIERSLATCASALALVGLRPSDLSAIYLSGGTSYAPVIRRALTERFRVPVRTGVPPDYAVCLGAGIHAAQLQLLQSTALKPR